MGFCLSLITRFISVIFLVCYLSFTFTESFDKLDPNGNITIKWDVVSWTSDGYDAIVTIDNFQKHRNIEAPGWTLGWTWAKKEVIWAMVGAQAAEQGDCSRFKGNIPHSCKKNPNIVDLLPGVPDYKQIADCCKGGVLSSWGKDPSHSTSAFRISVGIAGRTNEMVDVPKNFTLLAPGSGYTCGPTKVVEPSKFWTPDRRRVTQAFMTWKIICTYSGKSAARFGG